MAIFKYTAVDINSKKTSGKMEASSRSEVVAFLRSENLYLLKCKEVVKEKKKVKIQKNALSEFCRQIGAMLSSGISLITAMNIMTKRTTQLHLQNLYKDLYVKLQQGLSFSEALEAEGEAFPSIMINMIRASESTGMMDQTMLKLGDQFDREFKLNNKVKSAMTYPMFLLVATVVVCIAVFTLILPSFFDVFGDMELPLITQIMFAISRMLLDSWYWVLIVVLVIICLITMAMRIDTVQYQWDKLKVHFPKIKNLTIIIYTARFARSMSSLYTSGVSMIQSLQLARDTINNKYIEKQFDEVIRQVRDGTNLSAAISNVDGFDMKLASSIFIGEESGQLDQMLTTIANDFDYEAEIATERMVTLLQPIMIIILGFMIGGVLLSVMLPLYSLYGSIGAS